MTVAVTMFSGGRGAAAISRGLLRTPGVELSLVINGYDNGLSTGALRRHLPGMLGPSDFRKNLALHLDPADPAQAALASVLEHRLPEGATTGALIEAVGERRGPFTALPPRIRDAVVAELCVFARWSATAGFDLTDCAVGNLVFVGAYLRHGADFNAAVDSCARMFGSPVRLLNVTNGENAFLVALKRDGELLADEADIVAPQDPTPITDLFLLREPPDTRLRTELAGLPPSWAREVLARGRAEITPNPRALEAIADADLIVYGPGTPHSSLLPSYLTPGVADAIADNTAAAKVFVVNTRHDHDVQGLTAPDLVDRTLAYLGDPGNERRTVTHVLSHRAGHPGGGHHRGTGLTPDAPTVPGDVLDRGEWAGARWVAAALTEPGHPGTHCGDRTVEALLAIHGEAALARAR